MFSFIKCLCNMYQNDFLLSFDKLKYDFIVIALKPS